jgi:hypothetical protein
VVVSTLGRWKCPSSAAKPSRRADSRHTSCAAGSSRSIPTYTSRATLRPRRRCRHWPRGCGRGAGACSRVARRRPCTARNGSTRTPRRKSSGATATARTAFGPGPTPSPTTRSSASAASRPPRPRERRWTSPACPLDAAVTAIDALARAAQRHRGARGIRNARAALDLVDPGAESPRETWLRLLAIRAGFPRPQTQIPIYDEHGLLVCCVDMGWEDLKVTVEYDGAQHYTDARQFNKDIRRVETMTELGWVDVRVTSQDAPAGIIRRIRAARERRM